MQRLYLISLDQNKVSDHRRFKNSRRLRRKATREIRSTTNRAQAAIETASKCYQMMVITHQRIPIG
jgi:hypothetical protein